MSSNRLSLSARVVLGLVAGVVLTLFGVLVALGSSIRSLQRAATTTASLIPRLPGTRAHLFAAVDRVARLHPLRPTCLVRSLASYVLLRSQHIDARVVVGVEMSGTPPAAHAWIEIEPQSTPSHVPHVPLGAIIT